MAFYHVQIPGKVKIANGVANKTVEMYRNNLGLLIRTLRSASWWHRLVYLFTKRIPPTKAMIHARQGGYTVDSYDAWMRL